MYVGTCVFYQGYHVVVSPDCPHGRTEDEQGPIMPTGWTVQQG